MHNKSTRTCMYITTSLKVYVSITYDYVAITYDNVSITYDDVYMQVEVLHVQIAVHKHSENTQQQAVSGLKPELSAMTGLNDMSGKQCHNHLIGSLVRRCRVGHDVSPSFFSSLATLCN